MKKLSSLFLAIIKESAASILPTSQPLIVYENVQLSLELMILTDTELFMCVCELSCKVNELPLNVYEQMSLKAQTP